MTQVGPGVGRVCTEPLGALGPRGGAVHVNDTGCLWCTPFFSHVGTSKAGALQEPEGSQGARGDSGLGVNVGCQGDMRTASGSCDATSAGEESPPRGGRAVGQGPRARTEERHFPNLYCASEHLYSLKKC